MNIKIKLIDKIIKVWVYKKTQTYFTFSFTDYKAVDGFIESFLTLKKRLPAVLSFLISLKY